MLENYRRDEHGVVYQVNKVPMQYDISYTETRYGSSSGAPVEAMSHLRFGHVTGAIGRVPCSILDVGYGAGDFLRCAQKLVPDVAGFDTPPAYPLAGIDAVQSIYSRHFELVTFFDSLEHFEDPSEIKNLNADFVHVSVPWCHYYSDEWFLNWRHRRPNEHLWHFDRDSLRKFMSSVGFEMICYCNIEDTIRKSQGHWMNILSATFRRM